MSMAKPLILFLIVYLFLAALTISSSVVVATGDDHRFNWDPTKGRCQGSVADCMTDDEFGMDSEINRRILDTTNYVSYGALQRNTVPCSQRGDSYYNCQQSGQANPYNRACTALTQCRS
ncbi:hypothetical protein LWI28_002586 [Acer negundo]|uniref:Uncharacterized protein n=1 Tax=Acer negundo TaxID=4023 RepID=A0AAD5NTU8_ACENE|nr:hypothetical protein LWI28_002586 [Acer negundo]KAK4849304.1 hypothetical protein QYF36_023350 [Acer negundo]